jgi:hypothetical protein
MTIIKKNMKIIVIFIFSSLTEKYSFCINILKKELLKSPEIIEIKGIIMPKLSNSNSVPINIIKIIKANELLLFPESKNKIFLIMY